VAGALARARSRRLRALARGRYHRGLDLFSPGEAFAALYMSLSPAIAIWEMVRRSAASSLDYLANNVLSELEVEVTRVVDLSEQRRSGIPAGSLTRLDYGPCQRIAAAALAEGCQGLLVPSAGPIRRLAGAQSGCSPKQSVAAIDHPCHGNYRTSNRYSHAVSRPPTHGPQPIARRAATWQRLAWRDHRALDAGSKLLKSHRN